MMFCIVCEKQLIEHNLIKNVYYCANARCPRLGALTVFALEPKLKQPEPLQPPREEKKDVKDLPPVGGK